MKVYQNYSNYVNAICTTCITIDYLLRTKQRPSCYFQLEVDYCSSKINENKYKNFQLIASTKSRFKDQQFKDS